ncbi:MAG: biosynthetic-type acetolactate synthase large subunit [Acidiferrobacter sp.]
MTVTGAQLLVDILERQGVRLVAGIPGGAILPIYDALAHSRHIRHVLVRHEQGAGFVAQGFARATGEVGVCLASSGPGATNLLTAVADAKRDSIPLVVITGQVPRSLLGTDAFQEVDTYSLARPVTKYCVAVRSADELAEVVPRAFELAISGRPGPVWIDIPKDVQTELVSMPSGGAGRAQTMAVPVFTGALVSQAADWIHKARRPVLYLGGGLVHASATPAAQELAQRQDIPAVMTLMALGALPKDHALSLGMLGMHGAQVTHKVLQEADLLIALGARFDDRATGKLSAFCPQAKVIHVDIDPAELGKLRVADIKIEGDLKAVLEALLLLLPSQSRPAWRERIQVLRDTYPARTDQACVPRALIAQVAKTAPADAVIVTDVGQHQMWVAQHYPLRGPRLWLTSGGLGTMGFGLPVAIGAALAHPHRTVICFTGDGSLLMNIQELATAYEQDVDVKIIVMDNQSLGLVAQQQALFYEKRAFASTFAHATDYVAIARGFGIPAFDLQNDVGKTTFWRDVLMTRGPCLVRAAVNAGDHVLPIVPPGAAHWEAIGG